MNACNPKLARITSSANLTNIVDDVDDVAGTVDIRAGKSVNQSVKQSVNQSVSQSVSQPVRQSDLHDKRRPSRPQAKRYVHVFTCIPRVASWPICSPCVDCTPQVHRVSPRARLVPGFAPQATPAATPGGSGRRGPRNDQARRIRAHALRSKRGAERAQQRTRSRMNSAAPGLHQPPSSSARTTRRQHRARRSSGYVAQLAAASLPASKPALPALDFCGLPWSSAWLWTCSWHGPRTGPRKTAAKR